MSVFTSGEMSKKLADFDIIMKYMPFLQEHGFSEFGKGQLIGKIELLREGFSDSTANPLKQQFEPQISRSQLDESLQRYEKQDPDASSAPLMDSLRHSKASGERTFDDVGKNLMYSRTHQGVGLYDSLDQGTGKRNFDENNGFNFKNEDESSWITRIRRLADI